MPDLIYPDAGQWINALEAGQRAGMTDRRNAAASQAGGLMASGDYKGAAGALYGVGDFTDGSAIAKAGYDQTNQAQKLQRQTAVQTALAQGDFATAYQAAGTDKDLLEGLDKVAAHAKETTANMAGALQALKGPDGAWLPPDVARAKYQQIKPALAARGLDPRQLDSFDPTPENLDAIQGQVLGLKEQLDLSKPQVVGKSLVTRDGHVVYTDPTYEKVGADETLVRASGGAAPGGPAGQGSDASPTSGAGDQPRGLRNNNPLNVTALPHGQWDGQTGTDGKYAVFATPEAGMAAADKNLQAYATRHGINTLAGIVNRWAPASDGNDPAAYVARVAADLQVKPDQPLNLADPGVRSNVLHAMAKVELGQPLPGPHQADASKATGGAQVLFRGSASADEGGMSDDAIKLQASKYLQTGVVPPFGMGKAGTAARNKFYNEAAAQASSLNLTAADLVSGSYTTKALGASLTQMQKSLEATQSYEQTALANGDLMLKLAPKGGGQTNIPVVNRWLQAGRKQIAGDPDVTAFDNAIGAFSEEYAKVMTGNLGNVAATDGARKDASERLAKYATQNQLTQGYEVMKTEMENRNKAQEAQVAGIQSKLRAGVGGQDNAPTSPAATPTGPKPGFSRAATAAQRATAAKFANASAPSGDASNPLVPLNEAQYNALKPGTHYIHPDGSVRVKGG